MGAKDWASESCPCSFVRAVLWACMAAIPALSPSQLVSLSADSGKSSQAVHPEVAPNSSCVCTQTLWCSSGLHARYIARLTVTRPVCLPR